MDITSYVISQRTNALLVGNHYSYRAQLSGRIRIIGKRLGRATPKGKKYKTKPPVTAEDARENLEFVHFLLLQAERAWASAMQMRAAHSADPTTKGIIGSARRHIISRFHKARTHAERLVDVLEDQSSGASNIDVLEARAYCASLRAALWMEKQQWEPCLSEYSLARVIYSAIQKKTDREVFRDLLSSSIDPGVRYAAYQLKIPRSMPLQTISVRNFPSDKKIRAEVEALDPGSLSEESATPDVTADGSVKDLPETIKWRSRTVKIEDASISQALAAAAVAESQLLDWISGTDSKSSSAQDKATKYDSVIIASQDAVDATKTAIEELSHEGVDQGDQRMQALQVTRTAVNYALVGWRVGRNRVLCGSEDGLQIEPQRYKGAKRVKIHQDESTDKKLARLRERVVLYDATLQSLDFVKELPGVAGDSEFLKELDATRHYFSALRCLSIGRSHAFLSHPRNALGLFVRASDLASKCHAVFSGVTPDTGRPPRLEISGPQSKTLSTHLQQLIWQYRGIVEIERLTSEAEANSSASPPIIERLGEYPTVGLDLSNLVTFPPKLQPIPVKPLFLDVAWNYIEYPEGGNKTASVKEPAEVASQAQAETKKRGWFGFGR